MKVSKEFMGTLKDLIVSYKKLLELTQEDDNFLDQMRQCRITDCEIALDEIEMLRLAK